MGRLAEYEGRGKLTVETQALLDTIDSLPFADRLSINSGYRDPAHNARAGGAKKSQHIHGKALDINVSRLTPEEKKTFLDATMGVGARGIGIYKSGNVVHVDTRKNAAVWGPSPRGKYAGLRPKEYNLLPSWAKPSILGMLGGKVATGAKKAAKSAWDTVVSLPDTMPAPTFRPDIAAANPNLADRPSMQTKTQGAVSPRAEFPAIPAAPSPFRPDNLAYGGPKGTFSAPGETYHGAPVGHVERSALGATMRDIAAPSPSRFTGGTPSTLGRTNIGLTAGLTQATQFPSAAMTSIAKALSPVGAPFSPAGKYATAAVPAMPSPSRFGQVPNPSRFGPQVPSTIAMPTSPVGPYAPAIAPQELPSQMAVPTISRPSSFPTLPSQMTAPSLRMEAMLPASMPAPMARPSAFPSLPAQMAAPPGRPGVVNALSYAPVSKTAKERSMRGLLEAMLGGGSSGSSSSGKGSGGKSGSSPGSKGGPSNSDRPSLW